MHGDTSSAARGGDRRRSTCGSRSPTSRPGCAHGLTLSPFPEELNRQAISRIAAFHLAPTSTNEENLVRERVPYEQIFVTGNTGIDALRFASTLDVEFEDPAVGEAVASDDPVVTVTAHRRENWEGGLARIAEAIGRLAVAHPGTRFVVPQHPEPARPRAARQAAVRPRQRRPDRAALLRAVRAS